VEGNHLGGILDGRELPPALRFFVVRIDEDEIDRLERIDQPSVARSKPAMCGHFKTGHRTNVRDRDFYSFIRA
jgi:hypothetical protein